MTNALNTSDYDAIDQAYRWFNNELFHNALPACVITLTRKKNMKGYFHAEQWCHVADNQISRHEISLNPELFGQCELKEVLSTLVHEQCHLQQQIEGKPGKKGYHNKQWVGMMEDIGLTPVSLDKSGKQVGRKVAHTIDMGGLFDQACDRLIATGLKIEWRAKTSGKIEAKKRASKTKYACGECGTNAWAKPETLLVCGSCHEYTGEIVEMEADE